MRHYRTAWMLVTIIILVFSGGVRAENYTAILGFGQTPYQLGYLSNGNETGWNWWDTGGGFQQKNLILLSIITDNATPVSGLSPPAWIRDSSIKNSGNYSWKAGKNSEIHRWHYLKDYSTDDAPWEDIDLTPYPEVSGFFSKILNWFIQLLTGVNPAAAGDIINLTFQTNYQITNNYGYVRVSPDRGATWNTVAQYSGNSAGWVEKTVNLTAYGGQKILVAFDFSSNNNSLDEGWWIDDILVKSSSNGTIFSNDAENPPPELTVDVRYPSYNYSSNTFSNKTATLELVENYVHQFYYGIFDYPDDAYAGKYNVSFNTTINSSSISASTSFNTTVWGCQARGCHDSWSPASNASIRNPTIMIHPDNITSGIKSNCLTACHSTYSSQFLRATSLHLHEIIYGHKGGFIFGEAGWMTVFNNSNANVQMYYNTQIKRPLSQTQFNVPSHVTAANCTDCHTGFIHGSGGDSYDIASPYSLSGTYLNQTGVHYNVSCEACHGIYSKETGKGLIYPPFNSTTHLNDTLADYDPEFMSYEALTKTYIIDMNGSGTINVTVSGTDTSYELYLSLIGPINDTANGLQDLSSQDSWDGTYTVPSVNGTAVFATGSKIYYPSDNKLYGVTFNNAPGSGIWVARVFSISPGSFNYTITSSHPIQRKPVIHIPLNCSECHNPNASGVLAGAMTEKPVPSWDNEGLAFSHADSNADGKDDVTCRLCHNSFHEISIRNCTDCHKQRPGGHTMVNYYTMGYTGCLSCHEEPHFEPKSAAGGNCTDCHFEGGANASAGLPVINKTGFITGIHRNITGEFSITNYTQLSRVCWGCHVNYTIQLINESHTKPVSELPRCEDCHNNATPFNSNYLNKTPLQAREHQPAGEDIKTNATLTNCTICHNKSLAIQPPTTNVKYPTSKNYVSHYGRQRTDMWASDGNRTITNCSYCHKNNSEFNDVFGNISNTNITHDTGLNCTLCHGSGRIHDANLSVPLMAGGNNSYCFVCHQSSGTSNNNVIEPSFFNASKHSNLYCTDCHTPRQVIKGMIVDGESRTFNFTIPANATSLSTMLEWSGNNILAMTLMAPNGTQYNGQVNITSPAQGNWTAVVRDISGDAQFTLTINVSTGHPGSTPKICENCHIGVGFGDAARIYKHIPNQSNVPTNVSCASCHSNGAFAARTINISAAHYPPAQSLDTKDCVRCHTKIIDVYGNPPDQRNHTRYAHVNKTLISGEPWKLVDNYLLTLIETTREGAIFTLEKDGKLLRRELVASGDVFKYDVRGIDVDNTSIVNLTVKRLFTSKDNYAVELSGNVLASRIHRETDNKECYACHDSEYRTNKPKGMDYYVLKKDTENVTLAPIPVNFTELDTKMLKMGEDWNLGEGYSLRVVGVSLKRGNAQLQLYRNGTLIEDMIVNEGGNFTHEEWVLERKIDVFSSKLKLVFIGTKPVVEGYRLDESISNNGMAIVLSNVRLVAGEQKTLNATTQVLQEGTPLKYLWLDQRITIGEEPANFHVYTLTPGVYTPDCISCHSGNGVAPIRIDVNLFKKGVHAGLNRNANYTSFLSDEINKACWACHGNGSGKEPFEHPTPYLGNNTPLTCIGCHTYSQFGAKQISSHYAGAEISTSATCWDCHSNTVANKTKKPQATSHYSTRKDLLDTSRCDVCHNNETNAPIWGKAPQVMKHNSSNNCTLCHGGNKVTTFHDRGITIIRNCEDCHVNKERADKFNIPAIRTHYPGAPEDSANTLKNNDYTCHRCHNTTNKTLHTSLVVREYQNETMGYCFQCHSTKGKFPNKPKNEIRELRHGRYGVGVKVISGCEECHAGEGVSKFHTPTLIGKGYFTGTAKYNVECTACHEEHEERKYQPYPGIKCTDCHSEYGTAHFGNAQIGLVNESGACKLCHNKEADKFHNLTHIVANVTESAYGPCRLCHKDIEPLKGVYNKSVGIIQGGYILNTSKNVSNESVITCTSCHNATGENRFHYDLYPLGTVQNPGWQNWSAGNITKCKDCHTYYGGEMPFNATNMGTSGRSPSGTSHGLAPNCTLCHGGSDSISFHSLAATEFVPRIGVELHPETVSYGEPSLIQVTVVLPPLMKVTRAEYFIDEISREGYGFPLNFIIGGGNEPSALLGAMIYTTNLSIGKHLVFVHVRDSAGKWSKTDISVLTVTKPVGLVAAEILLKEVVPILIFIGLLFIIWRRIR